MNDRLHTLSESCGQLSLGVLEMAAGAGILAYGVQSGMVCFGSLTSRPQGFLDTLFTGSTIVCTGSAGIAIGTSIATPAAVTLLGSQTLGAWAVSAGFVAAPAAPMLPLVICGSIGLAIGYAGWKAIKLTLNQQLLNEISASIDADIIALPFIEKIEEESHAKLLEKYLELKKMVKMLEKK